MIAACPFPANHGSAGTIREMAETLANRGHEMHIVTYPLRQEGIQVQKGVKVHRIMPSWQKGKITVGPNKTKLLFDPIMVEKTCELVLKEKIDLLHAQNYEGAIIGFLAKLVTRRPLLYCAVNTMADELPSYNFIRPKALAIALARGLDYMVPRMTDFIIVNSKELFLYYLDRGIPERRMTILPPGVHVEDFSAGEGERIRRQYNLNDKPLVIFTGVLDNFQRLDYLFLAMQRVVKAVPEARLLVMGNLAKDTASFEQMVEEMGIASHVIFLFDQPFKELPHYLAAADVTVLPRPDTPGFPLKLLNYMSAGKPTVTFRSSAKGIFHLYNGIIVPDHDTEAFGDGIISLLRDPKLRHRLGTNARKDVTSLYGWDILAEAIEQVYETMLHTRRGPRLVHPMEMELRQQMGLPIAFASSWGTIPLLSRTGANTTGEDPPYPVPGESARTLPSNKIA